MNKKLIGLAGAMMLLANVSAQAQESKTFGLAGAFIGVGATVSQMTEFNSDTDMGFGIGAEIGLDVSTPWDVILMPSLRYSNRRTKQSDGGSFGTALGGQSYSYEADFNFSYIDLPIRVGYALDLGSVSLVPFVGPYLSYGLSGSSKATLNNSWGSGGSSGDMFKDNMKRFEIGYCLGARCDIMDVTLLKEDRYRQKLYLQLEYDGSLNKLNENRDTKWRMISLTVGLRGF